jgi:hypothetical protein
MTISSRGGGLDWASAGVAMAARTNPIILRMVFP